MKHVRMQIHYASVKLFIFQATEPRRSRKYPDLHKLEVELETAREEKLRAKKKRKLEAATAASEAKKAKTEGASTAHGE